MLTAEAPAPALVHTVVTQRQRAGAAAPARRAAAAARVRAAAGAYEGDLVGSGMKFGVVVGRFNDLVTKLLLEGALGAFKRHGVAEADVDVRGAGLGGGLL